MEVSLLVKKGSDYNFVIFRFLITYSSDAVKFVLTNTRIAAYSLFPKVRLDSYLNMEKLENLNILCDIDILDRLELKLCLMQDDRHDRNIWFISSFYFINTDDNSEGNLIEVLSEVLRDDVDLVDFNIVK